MIIFRKIVVINLIIFLECVASKPVHKTSQLEKAYKYLKTKEKENYIAHTSLGCSIFNNLKSFEIPEIKKRHFNKICTKVRLQMQLRLEHEMLQQYCAHMERPIFNQYYAIISFHPFDIVSKEEVFVGLFVNEQGHNKDSFEKFMDLYKKSGIAETNKKMLDLYYELTTFTHPKISAALKKAYEDLEIKTTADLLKHS